MQNKQLYAPRPPETAPPVPRPAVFPRHFPALPPLLVAWVRATVTGARRSTGSAPPAGERVAAARNVCVRVCVCVAPLR